MFLTWLAVRCGWPVGQPGGDLAGAQGAVSWLRALVLPSAALALPLAAVFERLQSRALARVTD